MIDHIYLPVTDLARSKDFYARTLGTLGWQAIGAYDSSTGPAGIPDLYGYGDRSGSSIWLRELDTVDYRFYVGIAAPDRASVDAVYSAALAAGATDAGGPAIRAYFGDGYYAANVLDPDGHTLEFVHKS
jgi:catechol 2,3-dioxygenase-like lactoylglutathione lyase family enzyme